MSADDRMNARERSVVLAGWFIIGLVVGASWWLALALLGRGLGW